MPEIADAVIVGGGLLGVALAYELARRTLRVVLLEEQESIALSCATSSAKFGVIRTEPLGVNLLHKSA